jgi:hypothetical protein
VEITGTVPVPNYSKQKPFPFFYEGNFFFSKLGPLNFESGDTTMIYAALRVWIRRSGAFLTPGSGMEKIQVLDP